MTNHPNDTEFAERIKRDCSHDDTEAAHSQADSILCELLTRLGYHETVTAWQEVDKWYA